MQVDTPHGRKTLWVVPAKNLPKVIEILGDKIELDKDEVETLTHYSPPVGIVYQKEKEYGKGKFEIIAEFPKYFVIEVIRDKEPERHEVPIENVRIAWEVVSKYPTHNSEGKPYWVKSSTVAKNICEIIGIDRFHRIVKIDGKDGKEPIFQEGTWDWQKFFGSRSDGYFPFFYYPIKILEAKSIVEHHKTGKIRRIGDKFVEQAVLIHKGDGTIVKG